MKSDIGEAIDKAITELGADTSMRRDRPYDGQPQTDSGIRGRTEVRGVTFRDLQDCFIRGVMLAAGEVVPERYEEATKGEHAILCVNDLYGFSLDKLDPFAIWQNMSCEIERVMGIYPNVPAIANTAEFLESVMINLDEPKDASKPS